MTIRYNRARLITADDRHYRQYVEQFLLGRDNWKATRPPRARDLFGGETEQALRSWLGQFWALSERRILEYEERRGQRWMRKYREIDAVRLEGRTIYVAEIKASRTAGAILRALQQLRETGEILGLLFQRVVPLIMFVDTGIPSREEVAALMAGPEAPAHPPLTFDELLAGQPALRLIQSLDQLSEEPGEVSLLRFSVQDIVELAGAENLHLDWDEPEEELAAAPGADAREQASPEQPAAADAEQPAPDEEESPFAAALKKAMQRRPDT